MSTTHQNPSRVRAGQLVSFQRPDSWGRGVIVEVVGPQRVIAGHDGRQVVWADSETHTDFRVRWTDGHEDFATEPGTESVHTFGHSFGGDPWGACWTVVDPGEES